MGKLDAPKDAESPQVARQAESTAFSNHSLASSEMKDANLKMAAEASIPPLLKAPESSTPAVPALLKAPATEVSAPAKPAEPPVEAPPPPPPVEEKDDQQKTLVQKFTNPCTKGFFIPQLAPLDAPKPLDLVKDRDPELYKQIKDKVVDPRYTGDLGNVTVSTKDAKGRVNGCTFEQNVPYWESGPAAKALFDVNQELAKKGEKLVADKLNGAGRTLGQEEAINWRNNSGVHAAVGKSAHGPGKAEDFAYDEDPNAKQQLWERKDVNALLHAHGWRQGDSYGPIKNDQHHWSFTGVGPTHDGHPPPPHHKPHSKHHGHHR